VAWIELPDGERRLLKAGAMTIGRDAANDLVLLDDPKVSRSHAELHKRDGQWVLQDLGSSNGTRVNQRPVQRHPLRDGDRIQLGATTILYRADGDSNATEGDTGALAKGPELSVRERQVLGLIAQGLTDKEIGERLFISASTVRSHLDRISDKTGLRRRAELTRLALEVGIVT
jgi:pSer/pThr/pTyr-binding forkhead associated (FHA) protein